MQNEWISTNDALPAKSGEYLAYTVDGLFFVLCYSHKHKAFNAFDSNSKEFAERHAFDVTHWMPLQKPLEAGADNGS